MVYAAKQVYIRFTGAQENGTVLLMEFRESTPFALWGRALSVRASAGTWTFTTDKTRLEDSASIRAAESGRLDYIPSHATKTGWNTLTHSQILHHVVRSTRECSLAICIEDATSFQSRVRAGRGPNPVRVDFTVAYSELFRWCERLEGNKLLLNLTVVNPCPPTKRDKGVKRPGALTPEGVGRKHNRNRGTRSLPTPYFYRLCRFKGSWIRIPKLSSSP